MSFLTEVSNYTKIPLYMSRFSPKYLSSSTSASIYKIRNVSPYSISQAGCSPLTILIKSPINLCNASTLASDVGLSRRSLINNWRVWYKIVLDFSQSERYFGFYRLKTTLNRLWVKLRLESEIQFFETSIANICCNLLSFSQHGNLGIDLVWVKSVSISRDI